MISNEDNKSILDLKIFFSNYSKLCILIFVFTVIIPFILLDYSHLVLSGEFFKDAHGTHLDLNNFTEVYITINENSRFTGLIVNCIFFILLIISSLLLKKKAKKIFFKNNHIIYLFYLNTSILFLLNILIINYSSEIFRSLYLLSIIVFNLSFFLFKNLREKEIISYYIYIFIFCFVVIYKGMIIDKSVFLSIIFFTFLLFFNLKKNYYKLIIIFFTIFLLVISFSFLKRFLYDYSSNLKKIKNELTLFIDLEEKCKNSLDPCIDKDEFQQVQKNFLWSIDLLEFKYSSEAQNLFDALIFSDKRNYKIITINGSWDKHRNNFIDGSKINNQYLKYFFQALNQIIKRFDLNYNLIKTIQLHENYPEIYKFKNGNTYKPILSKIIPRKFYQDKPIENYGNVYGREYGYLSIKDNDTTINLNIIIEGFINFSYIGLIIPFLIISILFLLIYFLNSKIKNGYFNLIISSQLLLFLIIMETNTSLILGRLLYLNIIIVFIYLFYFSIKNFVNDKRI